MNTKINQTSLSNWGTSIYDDNKDAISILTDFKGTVSSITDAYNSESAQAVISNLNSDLDNAIKCHTGMQSLQAFLDSVIENANNV